ncbi:MAG: hypothetical protein FWD25_03685 [Clostridia bacterium]|nr:hypothetical protein [Clostridia bacterium]
MDWNVLGGVLSFISIVITLLLWILGGKIRLFIRLVVSSIAIMVVIFVAYQVYFQPLNGDAEDAYQEGVEPSLSMLPPTLTTTSTSTHELFTHDSPSSDGAVLRVPLLRKNSLSVDMGTPTEIAGSITVSGQVDERSFTPILSGNYRFVMSGLTEGHVNVTILNSDGFELACTTRRNEEGINLTLEAGEVYLISIGHWNVISPYTLIVWHQKPIVNISAYSEVRDSMQYDSQMNDYSFTPLINGNYRFEISGLTSGHVNVTILNSDGFELARTTRRNGEGINLTLEAGETYSISIGHWNVISPYTLIAWHQKPTVDVFQHSEVRDSIQYDSQRNGYSFTPLINGNYRFEISGLTSGHVNVTILNSDGFELARTTRRNEEGINLTLEAGETYSISIGHWNVISPYTLNILR